MIITRTPLRISFVGGGSDLPWFYEEEPGAVVSAAIDKYVYVTLSNKYDSQYRAAYSQMETTTTVEELKHELIRETLLHTRNVFKGVEIHSIADLPGSTGLGSSSAFTVGLLRALFPNVITPDLAAVACEIEINRCKKSIGKQDQYATATGGLNFLQFRSNGSGRGVVNISSLECDYITLSRHILLVDTGIRRVQDAGTILKLQHQSREDVRNLAAMAKQFAEVLVQADYKACGLIMNYAWMIKSKFIRNPHIPSFYTKALEAGAWGGKLCGAGEGGFMMFLAPPEFHRSIADVLQLHTIPIKVGVPGTEVIYHD